MKKILLAVLIFAPIYLFSLFESVSKGAYSYAMGDASVAFSKGVSSIFINPAGLGKSSKISLTTTHQNIFGVNDLYNETFAVSFPLPYTRVAVGTNQLILLNQYSEQTYMLSGASIFRIKKVPIYIGLSAKILHSSVKYSGAENPTNLNLDFGVITDLRENFTLGFVLNNIFENKFSFLEYSDYIKPSSELGLAYNWRGVMNFTADYQFMKDNNKLKLGWELWFYNVFAPRIGLNGENLTAGFGIKSGKWALDAAILAHDNLGSNYKISFTYNLK